MKKSVLILALMLLFVLVGCATTKKLTIEQSKKNYSDYENSLQMITDMYNLKLIPTKDENIDNQDIYKDFEITVNSSSEIKIRIINSAYESEKGVESFSVEYRISSNCAEDDFNLQLFVDLANCISGKKISVDLCNEFLSAPESKYSSEKYGYKKLNDEIVAKQHSFDFFEDWNISYVLTKDQEQILTFGGLTKQ